HLPSHPSTALSPTMLYTLSLHDALPIYAIEKITHSLCTLEFQDHRPLYDWFINQCQTESKPQQIEFARLNLSHTITSKRKLKILDRKSTRLNSSHRTISYAVFCLKKKKK